jgi:outer membrane receptor protein involved in Fe transport
MPISVHSLKANISSDGRLSRLIIRLIVTLVGMLLLFANAPAQTSISITGMVTDQNKAVVVGAQVQALNIAGGQTVSVLTDSAGRYNLAGLQPGEYRLSVSSEGFGMATRSVRLRYAGTITEDFTLLPGEIAATITVTAGKGNARVAQEIPQTVTVADVAEIDRLRPASTLGAIERTPNLIAVGANPIGERPRLRGLASNRLLLMIDGERLNNVRSDPLSGISPSVVDVTQLQAVEVLSGAGSSLYGSDALGGVINLLTQSPLPSQGGMNLGLRLDGDYHDNGAFRRGALTLNWSVPRVAMRLSGSKFRAGSYRSGGESVPVEEVVRLGRFANDLGNAAGNNIARTYGVWELPAGAEISNGQGHGFNDQFDLWLLPSARHSLRYRQLNSQHKNIGFPFLALPFDPRNQFNSFRRLDKYGVRYEGHELTRWLPHLAGGFYGQKFSFADDNLVATIDAGSSWGIVPDPSQPTGTVSILTGRASTFTPGNFTSGKNSVTSYGLDAQATLVIRPSLLLTTGIGYLRDSSKDDFSRVDFATGGAQARSITGRASNPDTVYRNQGWFNLVEYEPSRWLRLTGGLRVDRWTTNAAVTKGFPLSAEAAILDASFERLVADPGPINIEGVRGIVGLVNGGSGISTARTVVTENIGAVLRLPGKVNPYFRWGTTYREPGITERYILRDFGDPTFSVLVVSNTEIKPERGRSFDAGVKVQRRLVNASFGYFRNDFTDFLRPVFSTALFVPADAARGLLPISPFFPFHGVLYVQRANTARARIQGYEASFEGTVQLGRSGSVSPFGTLGWLKGSDLTPDPTAVKLINEFYNRSDTPVRLSGSEFDAPLAAITPFRGIFGLRYQSARGKWFGEYEVRYQGRVERADPLELSATISTQYGTLASLNSFARQAARAGYTFQREHQRMLFTLGMENLTNRFYFEHFQNAPAPGRSVVVGVTLEFSRMLDK